MDNIRSVLVNFFLCSLLSKWDDFDFGAFFLEFRYHLNRKLVDHGLTEDFEEFYDQWYDLYEGASDIDIFCPSTNYVHVDKDDVYRGIARVHYNKYREAFEGIFYELVELRDRLDEGDFYSMSLPDMIILADACIHAQHENGFILEDYFTDPDELRAEAEEEYKDLIEEQRKKAAKYGKIAKLRNSGVLI